MLHSGWPLNLFGDGDCESEILHASVQVLSGVNKLCYMEDIVAWMLIVAMFDYTVAIINSKCGKSVLARAIAQRWHGACHIWVGDNYSHKLTSLICVEMHYFRKCSSRTYFLNLLPDSDRFKKHAFMLVGWTAYTIPGCICFCLKHYPTQNI